MFSIIILCDSFIFFPFWQAKVKINNITVRSFIFIFTLIEYRGLMSNSVSDISFRKYSMWISSQSLVVGFKIRIPKCSTAVFTTYFSLQGFDNLNIVPTGIIKNCKFHRTHRRWLYTELNIKFYQVFIFCIYIFHIKLRPRNTCFL